ncbi:uncharacterized protein LOC131954546 [Physella acuta]|uniref:uncharacterized protein LOC131954546 n=1 Tax=Physella acuta TaxID=109671 RepID=UPI0027DCE92E|nr:uncharacterized protein LOC131954546 [Physella acuta]
MGDVLKNGNNALLVAAGRGHTELVSLLLDQKADVNSVNQIGENAFIKAALKGQTETVKFLLTKDYNINQKDNTNYTALMLACQEGHLSTVELLLQHNARLSYATKEGNNALLLAASEGHTAVVELLLDQDADVNSVNAFGENALMKAVTNGHTKTAKFLLQKEISIHQKDTNGSTAFLLACRNGDLSTVELLIEYNACLTDVSNDGINALLFAAYGGHTDIVKLLLDHNVDINSVHKFGRNALMVAISMGKTDTIEFLLQKGINIHHKDNKNRTALLLACQKGLINTVELLLQHNASLNDVYNHGYSLLLVAVNSGHTEIVKLLLERNADISSVNKRKRNALMEAAIMGHADTVQFLLTKNFDVNQKAENGNTALLLACKAGRLKTVEILLENNASLNDADDENYNALLWASCQGHTEIVKLLLERGADITSVNKWGENALSGASFMGRTDTVKFLLTKGFNINQKNDNGFTALFYACLNGHVSTVELLLDCNASVFDVDTEGCNTLIRAAGMGHTEVVKLLLNKNADANLVSNSGRNALMEAAFMGHAETVHLLVTQSVRIEQSSSNGSSVLELASKQSHLRTVEILLEQNENLRDVDTSFFNQDLFFTVTNRPLNFVSDRLQLEQFQHLDVCLLLSLHLLRAGDKKDSRSTVSRSSFFTRLFTNSGEVRKVKLKLKTFVSLYLEPSKDEEIKAHIFKVMAEFLSTREFNFLEFAFYQKYFEILYKDMETRSPQECAVVGDILADLKYADLTITPMRVNKLLYCTAPHLITTILQTFRLLTGASRKFAKISSELGIVESLTERLHDFTKDNQDKVSPLFVKLSVGILINLLVYETLGANELNLELSQFLIQGELEICLSVKLLNVLCKGPRNSLLPSGEDIKLLIQWMKQGLQNTNRSFNGFYLATLIHCLKKICLQSHQIYEILEADPLDCLYKALCSSDPMEQEAAVHCLLAIAGKVPGKFKISEHTEIVQRLELMQSSEDKTVQSIVISTLWLVKREAIDIKNKQKILAPDFPAQWERSDFLGRGNFGCAYLLNEIPNLQPNKFIIKEIEFDEDCSTNCTDWSVMLKAEHHRLVKFFGFIKEDKKMLLFFEYLRLGSLRKYVKECSGLAESKIRIFTKQIIEGINYLHQLKPPIIHGDLRGDTVLLATEHRVKLTEFGLTRGLTGASKTKTDLVTVKWMAPELLKGDLETPFDHKVDIWSLACTVVEMATSDPPWPNHMREQHMYQLFLKNPPEYSLPTQSSREMRNFLEKLFQYDPSLRPSALQLFSDPFVTSLCQSGTETLAQHTSESSFLISN